MNAEKKKKAVLESYRKVLKDSRALQQDIRELRQCLVDCGFMEIPPCREPTQEDFDKAILNMDL